MYCVNCGKLRNSEDLFCVECGAKANKSIGNKPNETNGSENGRQPDMINEGRDDKAHKKPLKKILMSAIALALVVALGFGGMTVLNMISDTDSEIDIVFSVGDKIDFGGIQWRVLEERNGQVFLLSEYVLERRFYHEAVHDGFDITWANSDIRGWLNGEFYHRFTAEERSRIVHASVTTNPNPWFGTPGGGTTTDKIFLLSLEEVARYFGDSGELGRIRTPETHGHLWGLYEYRWWFINDQFNDNRKARYINGGYTWWFLRSPGYNTHYQSGVSGIDYDGSFGVHAGGVFNRYGVRPALWLKL